MKRLAILGASGHGKVVADTAELSGWNEIAFFDDVWPSILANGHWPVVGETKTLLTNLSDFEAVVVAIGNNKVRLDKLAQLKQHNAESAIIVHPSAQLSRYAVVKAGSVIFANAVINAGAEVGQGCIINTGAIVEHDCRLGDGVHVSPNSSLAGGVSVGSESWIGMGASVRQLINIGDGAIVGMASVVTKDVASGTVVVGNPARNL